MNKWPDVTGAFYFEHFSFTPAKRVKKQWEAFFNWIQMHLVNKKAFFMQMNVDMGHEKVKNDFWLHCEWKTI